MGSEAQPEGTLTAGDTSMMHVSSTSEVTEFQLQAEARAKLFANASDSEAMATDAETNGHHQGGRRSASDDSR